jgi:hypothetical protein
MISFFVSLRDKNIWGLRHNATSTRPLEPQANKWVLTLRTYNIITQSRKGAKIRKWNDLLLCVFVALRDNIIWGLRHNDTSTRPCPKAAQKSRIFSDPASSPCRF